MYWSAYAHGIDLVGRENMAIQYKGDIIPGINCWMQKIKNTWDESKSEGFELERGG